MLVETLPGWAKCLRAFCLFEDRELAEALAGLAKCLVPLKAVRW